MVSNFEFLEKIFQYLQTLENLQKSTVIQIPIHA